MAVTRRTHIIALSENPFDQWRTGQPSEFEQKLNAVLNGSERIVFMGQQEQRSSRWLVVTEELVMGPSNGAQANKV